MERGTCRLCLKSADLQDSHYIPRRAYSMNMARKLANANPVVISRGKLKQVADQLRGYTFCHDCEQMLSNKGEQWVLANIPDDQGKPFPLQHALIPENPVFFGNEVNVYAGRKIKAFDMDHLIYSDSKYRPASRLRRTGRDQARRHERRQAGRGVPFPAKTGRPGSRSCACASGGRSCGSR